ncbi:hypothetical protein FGG08_000723 [Glutinoglossum americanum]|uniref:Heterokaryon incompatibility domain-containing protein n=1 Tax=Glutinoglossum americanum TaxID=1670608 RepID=A0A9P8L3F6_9PEZI|nr:hypothetical protein FGG08_000723 [Glutinoglossum americanum]
MVSFQYSPLDATLREIRLLVLHPASANSWDSTLEISLIKSQLGGPITYSALSYTWGEPQPTYPILLDGMEFKVRRNLLEALRYFRSTKDRLTMWVDAICINQDDIRERESQVALIRNVYKEAEIVWAWLGAGNPTQVRSAFYFLHNLASRELKNITEDLRHAKIPRAETMQLVESEATNDTYVRRWLDVAYLLDSLWFSRMWVIQEVVMGQKVYVVCGHLGVSWDEVISLACGFILKYWFHVVSGMRYTRRYKLITEKLFSLSLSARQINEIARARMVRMELPRLTEISDTDFRPKTVYQMASHYQHFNITEPRDRVYALLGILEEYNNNIKCPSISYSIPLADLYWEIIKSDIEYIRNLDFLSEALGQDRPYGTPSWVPYWHDGILKKDRETPIISLELAPEITYKATATTLPFCYFNSRLKALRIAGFTGAVIRQVGEICDLSDFDNLINSETRHSRQMQHLSHIFDNWTSILDIKDILGGSLPYKLDIDGDNPSEKQGKAYQFISMINMINEIHEWSTEKLFATYESKVQMHSTVRFITATSKQTYLGTRQLEATKHRRLFITHGEKFGLGPKATQPGDVVVFFYGCRVPMILRPVKALHMWRVVGEAYCQYEMNGEMLEPDIAATRYTLGVPDMLFWVI